MGWKATGREGGGARAHLQSVVTNVDGRGEGGVGRRLEPASTRKGLLYERGGKAQMSDALLAHCCPHCGLRYNEPSSLF